jgi:uncharacterized 2Fe-2S/4Fe-4S cluster protein (DUF4445 family)
VQRYTVLFQPNNIMMEVDAGVDLLTAARQANIEIKCSCGGDGTCGKCLVKVLSGLVKQKSSVSSVPVREGYSIACQTLVLGDVQIEVPSFSRLVGHQVLMDSKCDMLMDAPDLPPRYKFKPLCQKATLQLTPPSLIDPTSDTSRLLMALKSVTGIDADLDLYQIRRLGETLRQSGWHVDVTFAQIANKAHVINIEPHNNHAALWGLAVDVGTTTVVAYLVDLLSGVIIGKAGTHNKQAQFGDDVITRIIHTVEEAHGLQELQNSIIQSINELIVDLVRKYHIRNDDIRAMVCAGNTTMAHLLLGIDPRYIRLEPYIPVASNFPVVKARELNLVMHPEAIVYNFPAIASYVGGDIVAGTLVNGMFNEEPLTLFIDIGTNGEMVLGNKDWLVSCSCSAGPSFEGSGITYGMRAMQGAIERIQIDKQNFEVTYSTIGGTRPLGICGSGLIDALAKMRKARVIDRAGKFQSIPTSRMRKSDAGVEFVLAWAEETASGKDVIMTEADVKNLLRAKAAVFAGIRSLLKTVDMDMSSIERIYIAGGFGSYLNIPDAVEIGLLPDLPTARYQFIGNTSVKGAYTALISADSLVATHTLAECITYVELSSGNIFMEEFISALFLPHTDLHLFPSVSS